MYSTKDSLNLDISVIFVAKKNSALLDIEIFSTEKIPSVAFLQVHAWKLLKSFKELKIECSDKKKIAGLSFPLNRI